MPNNNENYIGVAMGLDVSDLRAGLKETSQRIKEANAEFKTASSGMDDWQKSIDGVRAKVKQLDSVLDSQKKALSGMETEYKRIVAAQGESSDAARKMKLRIEGQKAAINVTSKELNNYKETLDEAEKGNVDLTKATIKNGKALDTQAESADKASKGMSGLKGAASVAVKGMAAIGAAAAGLMTGFFALAESTREFREDMAKLDSAFKGANLSAESAEGAYKTLFGVIGESDTAVEASQQIALLANSEEEVAKWADVAAGVVGTFGDALKAETFFEAANETIKLGEATGAFTQMLEGTGASVDDFNAGLAACTTEEEKQAYMLEISNKLLGEAGKAYNETAKDIIEAREAEANLTQAMADLGAVAEPIMTTLKNLVAELLKSIQPFVELIGNGLKGAFEGTAGAAETLAEGLNGIIETLLDKVMNLIPKIISLIAELLPKIIETILNALPQLLDVIVDVIIQIINMLGTLLPDIVSKIIEIVPMLIDSLVAAIPDLINAAVQFLLAIVDAIPILIEQLLAELPSIIQTIIDGLLNAIPLLIQAAIQLFNAIIEAIPVIIEALVQALPSIINTIIDGLLNAIPLLLQGAIQLLMAIIDALPFIIKILVQEIPKIVTTIINTLLSRLPDLIQGAIQLFMGILEAIPQIIMELIKQLPTIITTIVESLLEGIPQLIGVGADLIGGLMEGMFDFDIWGSIQKLGSSIVDGFKSFFDINSPSKLMEDKIGEYLGEGVGEGIIGSIPKVKKNINSFSDYVANNLGNIKGGLALNGVNNTSTGNGINHNGATIVNAGMTVNYNGTLSRKELRKLEQDNDRRIINKLKKAGGV